MNRTAQRWILIFVALLLAVDFFYQLIHSQAPFWMTDWFWWRVMVILLIIAFILIYYSSLHYKKSEIEKYNFIKNLVELQDIGYRKIAAELHDGLGQNLIVLNNKILNISNNYPDNSDIKNELKNVTALISETIDETRNISSRLYPHQIEKLGLKKALESMFDKTFSNSNINTDISVDSIDNLLGKNNEISYYRIIQECVNNILKHSDATETTIKINCSAGDIITEIKDNGKGFKFNKYHPEDSTGFGLSNIKHRLLLAGGRFSIDTNPGKGTNIIFHFPIII